MDDIKLSPSADTPGPQASVRIVQSRGWSMESLRALPPQGLLVLFTPPMPPRPDPASEPKEAIDPFESLGQALSRHHKRIRHVPYIPKIGLTDTHLGWLRKAQAIVTVNCQSPSDIKNVNPEEDLANQASFAEAVLEAVNSMRSNADDITLSCIYCGPNMPLDLPSGLLEYDNLIHSPSYSVAHLQDAADLLLGGGD